MTDVVTGSLQVDLKRRTTLPGDILAAAGIPAGSPLVARVEEPGRIVLESPALLLALLQDDIAAALGRPTDSGGEGDSDAFDSTDEPDGPSHRGAGRTRDLVAELLAERAADSSLMTGYDDKPDQPAEAKTRSPEQDSPRHSRTSSDGSAAADTPDDSPDDLPHPRDGAA